MLAVLQDAVECFQEYVVAQYPWEEKLFQEAEDWILEKNTDWPFSFENIWGTLQLHPDYIRRGLRSWKEAKRKECFIQAHSAGHKKLVKKRVARTSVRLKRHKFSRVERIRTLSISADFARAECRGRG
jgi:hypothetical protein